MPYAFKSNILYHSRINLTKVPLSHTLDILPKLTKPLHKLLQHNILKTLQPVPVISKYSLDVTLN